MHCHGRVPSFSLLVTMMAVILGVGSAALPGQFLSSVRLDQPPIEGRGFDVITTGTVGWPHYGVVSIQTITGFALHIDLRFEIIQAGEPRTTDWFHREEVSGLPPGWHWLTIQTYYREGLEWIPVPPYLGGYFIGRFYVSRATRDLSATALALDPPRLRPGQILQATASVECTGNANSDRFLNSLYLSEDEFLDHGDRLLLQFGPMSLEPGESECAAVEVVIPADAAPGNRHMFCVIDATNVILESTEYNNVQSAPLTLINSPQVIGNYLLGVETLPPPGGDANGDGAVDVSDLVGSVNLER